MIKLIQTGRQVHSVVDLMDRYIVKVYTSKEIACREADGLMVFNKVSPENSPKIIFRFGRVTVFDKLKASESNDLQLCESLAQVILRLSQTAINDNIEWQTYLNLIAQKFFDQKNIFQSYLNSKEMGLIENTLVCLTKVDWESFPIQPLHRDLHLGNLINTKSGVKIIDFEHFRFGPLEYEFSNSLLFDDESSLNISQISKKLYSFGVFLNLNLALMLTVVYFIEQFCQSYDKSDLNKQKLLIQKFINLTKRNNIFDSLKLPSKCLTDN